ncbi:MULTISPECIES: LptF/LptG family permease [Helicobacter]|uniref:LptF/LptG family permease n=1 Tax=Helicobacter ibis TaxID=2962633 RepID=A0ABT4VDU4_9HELI|nr:MULTISPECIES: LptF/LptG family permease [Helicobacter]MDA3966513.1 LptF/LptG family permease [Helicobacter sp. WB40]MDA3968871.1 LptF/LptG family permease [Helicobacter ibis]
MSLFTRYISFLYLKSFLIVFVSLECFFVLIDFVKYLDSMPDSANLVVLLLFYSFIYASNFILPLSLVLSQIVFIIVLLKSSQFTAFLSLGYSKARIFNPIFAISFLITIFYILLNTTSFAYAREKMDLIVEQGFISSFKKDLFVKYNNNYIYFEKIFPLLQSASNVKIYEMRDNVTIRRIIESKEARFDGVDWILDSAKITTIDDDVSHNKPLQVSYEENFKTLNKFKPKILDNIYEKHGSVSIVDAYEAIELLKTQGVNIDKLRGSLYYLLFFPFFAPLAMVCLSNFTPNSNRYVSLGFVGFIMILCVLMLWGIFFSFSRLSMSGFLAPEFSILLPMFILFLCSCYFYNKLLRN